MVTAYSPHRGRNLVITILLIIILYAVSVFFYNKFEGWEYLDAIYFITMTITTIGYGDLAPATSEGKIFTIFLAFIGISLAFLLISSIASYRQRTIDKHVARRLSVLRGISPLAEVKKGSRRLKTKLEEGL
jgi:voltage-gated potassium channel